MHKTILMHWMLLEIQRPGSFKQLAWELLGERDANVNISHHDMPTWEEHCAFVCNNPYRIWNAIMVDGIPVGTVYLSKQNEIGVFVLAEHQGHGYAKDAIQQMLAAYKPLPGECSTRPGTFVAHVNPANTASIRLFESLGAKHIQNTYKL